jgi:hypothetical protein
VPEVVVQDAIPKGRVEKHDGEEEFVRNVDMLEESDERRFLVSESRDVGR